MAQQTAMQTLWDWIDANCHEDRFNINDAREMSLRLEMEQNIKLYRWMQRNDIPKNAERFFGYTDEDMISEYLNETYTQGNE